MPVSPLALNDRFLPAGLAIVCLCSGWGANIYATQAMILVIVAFCALCFSIGDWILSVLGAYMAIWYTVLYATGLAAPAIIAESITLFGYGLIIYILVRFGRTSTETYLDTITTAAVLLSILGLVGYFTGRPAVATLGNQNFLGAFLAVAALACFRKKRGPFLVLILPALWVCHTSTAVAAFCFGLGFIAWRWKGAVLSIIPGAVYFFFIDGHTFAEVERLAFWRNAWDYLSASWWTVIFGFGPGIPWNPGNGMLHSEPVNLFWNLGAAGVVLAALYIWRATRAESDRCLTAMFLAVLVDGIGNHIFHTIPTAMLSIFVFALNDRQEEV